MDALADNNECHSFVINNNNDYCFSTFIPPRSSKNIVLCMDASMDYVLIPLHAAVHTPSGIKYTRIMIQSEDNAIIESNGWKYLHCTQGKWVMGDEPVLNEPFEGVKHYRRCLPAPDLFSSNALEISTSLNEPYSLVSAYACKPRRRYGLYVHVHPGMDVTHVQLKIVILYTSKDGIMHPLHDPGNNSLGGVIYSGKSHCDMILNESLSNTRGRPVYAHNMHVLFTESSGSYSIIACIKLSNSESWYTSPIPIVVNVSV